MKQFLCECRKTKGKLLSVLLPVLAIILLWLLWAAHDPSEEMLKNGYTYMQSNLLVLNSVFLSVTAAVMASRLMDMENKGNTYKLLCTLQKKSTIFSVKLLLSLFHLLLFFLLEAAGAYAIGRLAGFTESFPASDYIRLLGVAFLTSALLFIFQMFFSLRLENQLYPLFIGLIGSFVGLFSMFFPNGSRFLYLCPWSYFTLGGSHIMVWNEETKTTSFVRIPFDAPGFLILLTVLIAAYFGVRRYFLRKEV